MRDEGNPYSTCIAALRDEFGISERSAKRRLADAKAAAEVDAQAERADIRTENLARYRLIYRRALAGGAFAAATKALERVDKLYGTEEATKIEVTERQRVSPADVAGMTPEQITALKSRAPDVPGREGNA